MKRNYKKVTPRIATAVIRIPAVEENKTFKEKVVSLPLDTCTESNRGTQP